MSVRGRVCVCVQVSKQKFHALLTSYELLMGVQDRPRLSRMQWHCIVVDEGHRWGMGHCCCCIKVECSARCWALSITQHAPVVGNPAVAGLGPALKCHLEGFASEAPH